MNIIVDNIKCNGCAGSITKKLQETFNTTVSVNVEEATVTIDINNDQHDEVAEVLLGLGYPELNSIEGFNAVKAKAKSFVSCAIGTVNNKLK